MKRLRHGQGLRLAVLLAGLCGLCLPVAAQSGGIVADLPSEAVACMTPEPGLRRQLAYPEAAYLGKEGGTVQVELRFDAPDRAPEVRMRHEARTLDALETAVREHVAAFRVPCLRAGHTPLILRQDYVFVPNDGRKVVFSKPVDVAEQARLRSVRACLSHESGSARPEYPRMARKDGIEGKVLVRMRVSSPDRAPEVTTLASSHKRLTEGIESHLSGLRARCFSGEPLSWVALFEFKLEEGTRTVLKDLPFKTFLGAVKLPPDPVFFKLDELACPFDVRLTYFQPHSSNTVGEVEAARPERRAFLDWLSQLQFKLPEQTNTAVLGDTMTLTVPCGTLNLN